MVSGFQRGDRDGAELDIKDTNPNPYLRPAGRIETLEEIEAQDALDEALLRNNVKATVLTGKGESH